VDNLLKRLHTLDILVLCRAKRVQHGFIFTSSVNTPLNALTFHQFAKSKGCRNHTDRPDDRAAINVNLIRARCQPISTGRRNIFAKCVYLNFFLIRQASNACGNQGGLHRRTSGGIYHQRHSLGFALGKRAFNNGRKCSVIQASAAKTASTPNNAIQADHGNSSFGPKAFENLFHMGRCMQPSPPTQPNAPSFVS